MKLEWVKVNVVGRATVHISAGKQYEYEILEYHGGFIVNKLRNGNSLTTIKMSTLQGAQARAQAWENA